MGHVPRRDRDRRPARPREADRRLVAVPLVLIVAITIADILSPPEVHLGPLLVVAPALTASFGGALLTGAIGVLAMAALSLIAVVRGNPTGSNHLSQLVALLLTTVFTVFFCRWRERHTAELLQVRSVAETAQRVVMSPLPERLGPLRVATRYEAAADQARIGGDLYAAVRTRTGTRLLIGDVRGKGLGAIDEAGLLLGAFRSAAHRELTLPWLHRELEATLAWELRRPDRPDGGRDPVESFTTALLLDVPDDTPEVTVLACGHPPPLLLRAGTVTPLTAPQSCPPIGVTGPREADAPVETYGFGAGDVLLLHTDGVTEARDAAGRFFPLADRVAGLPRRAGPRRLVAELHGQLLEWAGGALDDDAVLLALGRPPQP
jgi:hypothetical protein